MRERERLHSQRSLKAGCGGTGHGETGKGKELQEGIRPIESRQMALISAEQLALPCHDEY